MAVNKSLPCQEYGIFQFRVFMNEQGLQIQCPVDKFSLFGPAAHGGDKGHQAESEEKDSEGLTLPK